MPEFCPSVGGYLSPIGRSNGFGVNFSWSGIRTHPLGASFKGCVSAAGSLDGVD